MPLGCSATGLIAPHDVAQPVGLVDRDLARRRLLRRHRIARPAAPTAPSAEQTTPTVTPGREPPSISTRCSKRRQDPDERDRAGDAQHLRRRAGAGLPEQQQRSRPAPGAAAARVRRSSSRSPRLRHDQQQPADRPGHAASASDQRRGLPAVAIDRPRLAHVAQPQALDFGRHAFEPLTGNAATSARGTRRRSAPAPTASASRRFQSAGDSHARPNSKAPPSKASDSHTGDKASQTASRLA